MQSPVKKENYSYSGWLFFIYRISSKPVNNRMKIWRKLNKAGALQFKGTAYLLPNDEDHYEFFDWLVSEVSSLGGEAAMIKADRVENIEDGDIVDLFNLQRESDYETPAKSLQNLERKVNSVQKGSKLQDAGKLKSQLKKYLKEYEEVKNLDFFSSKAGIELQGKTQNLRKKIEKVTQESTRKKSHAITIRNIVDYHGKTWVTRPNPFVDRMATAWLVKRFIDADAKFGFAGEENLARLEDNMISYDVRDGEFTHVGDMCTFEVVLTTFGLKEKRLKKIADIVHDLDMKDDKYSSAEAKGLEDILSGIRKSSPDDKEALEKGMAIFEMLYVALT